MIRILYFASLRDRLECDREELELPARVSDVQGLASFLAARGDVWGEIFDSDVTVLSAINQLDIQPDIVPVTVSAALQYITYIHLRGHNLRRFRMIPVLFDRIPGNNPQILYFAQVVQYGLHGAIDEVHILLIRAIVNKRQNRNGFIKVLFPGTERLQYEEQDKCNCDN